MFLNRVYNFIDINLEKFLFFYFSSFEKLICYIQDIKIGKKCKFNGRTIFKRGSSCLIQIGNNCTFLSRSSSNLIGINRPCIISSIGTESEIIIGNNCGFSGTVIGCFKSIVLGDNVRCGANTLITDSDWHLEDIRVKSPKPIKIGDNVWLGVNVTVLKGVSIGKNSIIGAGSIVTSDIPDNVIASGIPCRVLKSIE